MDPCAGYQLEAVDRPRLVAGTADRSRLEPAAGRNWLAAEADRREVEPAAEQKAADPEARATER